VQPDMPGALIDLAWSLATSERPDVRAPGEAVRLAERAAERTGHDNATVLDTLAVAYAAVGQRERALAAEENALTVASRVGPPELIEQIRLRLERFRQSLR
jgi:predicted Zn-dependent protease